MYASFTKVLFSIITAWELPVCKYVLNYMDDWVWFRAIFWKTARGFLVMFTVVFFCHHPHFQSTLKGHPPKKNSHHISRCCRVATRNISTKSFSPYIQVCFAIPIWNIYKFAYWKFPGCSMAVPIENNASVKEAIMSVTKNSNYNRIFGCQIKA